MMERRAMQAAEQGGEAYEPVTERGAQVHAIRQRRDLLADLRQRAEQARDVYNLARAQDASRLSAAVEAAKTLFSSSGSDDFAAGFNEAWQDQENARQFEAEQAREAARLQQLEDQRLAFIEEMAQAWEASRQIEDMGLAKEGQDELIGEVKEAVERFGVGFEDLALPINERANEVRDENLEQERQQDLKREKTAERARDSGMGHGM